MAIEMSGVPGIGRMVDVLVVPLPRGNRAIVCVSSNDGDPRDLTPADVRRICANLRALMGEFDDAPMPDPGSSP